MKVLVWLLVSVSEYGQIYGSDRGICQENADSHKADWQCENGRHFPARTRRYWRAAPGSNLDKAFEAGIITDRAHELVFCVNTSDLRVLSSDQLVIDQ